MICSICSIICNKRAQIPIFSYLFHRYQSQMKKGNIMEKNHPLNLDFDVIRNQAELVKRAEFRTIHQGIGMIISFAQMGGSPIFRTGQPYRTKEIRIIRILKGTARISINLVEYKLREQMIAITPPHSLIELIELSKDYDFQIIVFEDSFLPIAQNNGLADLFSQHGIHFLLTDEEWKYTEDFFSLLWKSTQSTPFRREEVQHLVLALLYNIRYAYDRKQTHVSSRLSRQEEIFRRFITLVNEYGKRERNVSFYADKLFLTSHYLSTVIREASGQTVMQWINQAIILEAKVMLKHSDMLIFQISDALNFPNPSFFSKFFKRMTGMTSAEYQKE